MEGWANIRYKWFSLYAGVVIEGENRVGLKRLSRYAARPSATLSMLSYVTPEDPDRSDVELALKREWSAGSKSLILKIYLNKQILWKDSRPMYRRRGLTKPSIQVCLPQHTHGVISLFRALNESTFGRLQMIPVIRRHHQPANHRVGECPQNTIFCGLNG